MRRRRRHRRRRWRRCVKTKRTERQISPFYCNKFNEFVSFLLHTFDKDFMSLYEFNATMCG